jgi:hypothetical protein
MKDIKYLYLLFVGIGFIFLKSSYGKFTGGTFVSGLADTLTKFASKNPYPWYKSFLTNIAIPNSQIFGMLTMYGELFAGATLFGVSLYLLMAKKVSKMVYSFFGAGLLVGAFLNGTFWLASGYTSPSTDGLNLLMFFAEVIGILYILQKVSTTDK